MSRHSEPIFRPSYFPALEECIRFEPRPAQERPEADRGTNWHAELAAVLSSRKRLDQIEDLDCRGRIRWAVQELRQRRILITATELESAIVDEFGEMLTVGHLDAEGKFLDSNELVIIDAKTGDRREYAAQFAGYGLGRMDALRYRACVVIVLWLDLGEVDEYDLSYTEAESRIWKLRQRFVNRSEEVPVINEFCDWCGLRPKCPAWLAQGEKALAVLPDWQPVVRKLEALKRDPQQLGEFMTAYRRLQKLVDDDHQLRSVIFDYLQSGVKIPGWTLTQRKLADKVVNKEEFVRAIFNKLGVPRTAAVISVSAAKLEAEWAEAFPGEELPVEIERGSTIYFARAVQPKGRGLAALRRKERAKLKEQEVEIS
jgi:hypothetical protein